jgi:type VI secretion system secreted protein Hcp
MASDVFLKLDGIEGDSIDADYPKQIQVDAYSLGTTGANVSSASARGASKPPALHSLEIRAHVSGASAKMFKAAATGQPIKKAVLTMRKSGGGQEPFYVLTLSDVHITRFNNGGKSGESDLPLDEFELDFGKIEIEYRPQDAKGNLGAPVKIAVDTFTKS